MKSLRCNYISTLLLEAHADENLGAVVMSEKVSGFAIPFTTTR